MEQARRAVSMLVAGALASAQLAPPVYAYSTLRPAPTETTPLESRLRSESWTHGALGPDPAATVRRVNVVRVGEQHVQAPAEEARAVALAGHGARPIAELVERYASKYEARFGRPLTEEERTALQSRLERVKRYLDSALWSMKTTAEIPERGLVSLPAYELVRVVLMLDETGTSPLLRQSLAASPLHHLLLAYSGEDRYAGWDEPTGTIDHNTRRLLGPKSVYLSVEQIEGLLALGDEGVLALQWLLSHDVDDVVRGRHEEAPEFMRNRVEPAVARALEQLQQTRGPQWQQAREQLKTAARTRAGELAQQIQTHTWTMTLDVAASEAVISAIQAGLDQAVSDGTLLGYEPIQVSGQQLSITVRYRGWSSPAIDRLIVDLVTESLSTPAPVIHRARLAVGRRLLQQRLRDIERGYDVRGITEGEGATMTPALAYTVGTALAMELNRRLPGGRPRVLITGDHRASTPALREAFRESFKAHGVDVDESDEAVSTPAANIVPRLSTRYDGSVQVTASHNPWTWRVAGKATKPENGFKVSFRDEDGYLRGVFGQELASMLQAAFTPQAEEIAPEAERGEFRQVEVLPQYLAHLRQRVTSLLNRLGLTQRDLDSLVLVVNPGHGVMGPIAKQAIESLGITYVGVNDAIIPGPDGEPAHTADPLEQHAYEQHLLPVVQQTAREHPDKIVLGIPLDGDGDRVGLTDEEGRHYLTPTQQAFFYYANLLKGQPGAPVVLDIRSGQEVIELIDEQGTFTDRHAPGWPIVRQALREANAPLGVEGSKHTFKRPFKDPNEDPIDDGLWAGLDAAAVALRLAKDGSSITQQLDRLWYPELQELRPVVAEATDGERYDLMPKISQALTERINAGFAGAHIEQIPSPGERGALRLQVSDTQGAFIGWVLIRASNTSAPLSIKAQGRNQETLADLSQILWDVLKTFPAVDQAEVEKILKPVASAPGEGVPAPPASTPVVPPDILPVDEVPIQPVPAPVPTLLMPSAQPGQLRVAINGGAGRIGTNLIRAWLQNPRNLELVALNDPDFQLREYAEQASKEQDPEKRLAKELEPLTEFKEFLERAFKTSSRSRLQDASVVGYGKDPDGTYWIAIEFGGATHRITVTDNPDPTKLEWAKRGVDMVLEASGQFTERVEGSKKDPAKHLQAGARYALVTAPAKGDVLTVAPGINQALIDPAKDVFSCASCTTNAAAAPLKVLTKRLPIEFIKFVGVPTTHSKTSDQPTLDRFRPGNLGKGVAAGENIAITTSGAGTDIAKLIPELKGKVVATAIRVPTPNGSLIPMTIEFKEPVTKDQLHRLLRDAAEGELAGIMAFEEKGALDSQSILGRSESSIINGSLTTISPSGRVAILWVWYDNEFGYSNRVLDLAQLIWEQGTAVPVEPPPAPSAPLPPEAAATLAESVSSVQAALGNLPAITPPVPPTPRKGSVGQGLLTLYTKFKDRSVTVSEFMKERAYGETTSRTELKTLVELGLATIDDSERSYRYRLAEEVRNLSPPGILEIAAIPALDRFEIPKEQLPAVQSQIRDLIARALSLTPAQPVPAQGEQAEFQQRVTEIEVWWQEQRARGRQLKRLHSADQVAGLRIEPRPAYRVQNAIAWKLYDLLRHHQQAGTSINTLGPFSEAQLDAFVRAGIPAFYIGGWAESMRWGTADLARYPYDYVARTVARYSRFLQQHERNQAFDRSQMSPEQQAATPKIDFMVPLFVDIDETHGVPKEITEAMMTAPGEVDPPLVAAVHAEDQAPRCKKCGHMSGKVLVSTEEHVKRLNEIRLQLDVMGLDTLIVARTDAEAAEFITSNLDERDQPFIVGATALMRPYHEVIQEARARGLTESEVEQIHKAWKENASLMTLGEAVAKAIERVELGGQHLEMTAQEWRQFAKTASYKAAKAKANELGITIYTAAQWELLQTRTPEALHIGINLLWDWDLPKTEELGYNIWMIESGLEMAIARSKAFVPYADISWMEQHQPDAEEAAEWAHALIEHAKALGLPQPLLANNTSPSFYWRKKIKGRVMTDEGLQTFLDRQAKAGIQFNFITYGGAELEHYYSERFLSDFRSRGMLAWADFQDQAIKDGDAFVSDSQGFAGYRREAGRIVAGRGGSVAQPTGERDTMTQFREAVEAAKRLPPAVLPPKPSYEALEHRERVLLDPVIDYTLSLLAPEQREPNRLEVSNELARLYQTQKGKPLELVNGERTVKALEQMGIAPLTARLIVDQVLGIALTGHRVSVEYASEPEAIREALKPIINKAFESLTKAQQTPQLRAQLQGIITRISRRPFDLTERYEQSLIRLGLPKRTAYEIFNETSSAGWTGLQQRVIFAPLTVEEAWALFPGANPQVFSLQVQRVGRGEFEDVTPDTRFMTDDIVALVPRGPTPDSPAVDTGKSWGAQAALPTLDVVRANLVALEGALEGVVLDLVEHPAAFEEVAEDAGETGEPLTLVEVKRVNASSTTGTMEFLGPWQWPVSTGASSQLLRGLDASLEALLTNASRFGGKPHVAQVGRFIKSVLSREDNARLQVVVVKSGVLHNQMARYDDQEEDRAVIAIDEIFYRHTIGVDGLDLDRPDERTAGALRIVGERFLHELAHDNAIGTYDEELAEETRVLHVVDFFLYEKLGGADENVEVFLRSLPPEVKPLVTGADKYQLFATLLQEAQQRPEEAREPFLREGLREYARTIVSGDLRRFGKAAGLPPTPQKPDIAPGSPAAVFNVLLWAEGPLTRAQIARALDREEGTIRKDLNALKDLYLLTQTGNGDAATYELASPEVVREWSDHLVDELATLGSRARQPQLDKIAPKILAILQGRRLGGIFASLADKEQQLITTLTSDYDGWHPKRVREVLAQLYLGRDEKGNPMTLELAEGRLTALGLHRKDALRYLEPIEAVMRRPTAAGVVVEPAMPSEEPEELFEEAPLPPLSKDIPGIGQWLSVRRYGPDELKTLPQEVQDKWDGHEALIEIKNTQQPYTAYVGIHRHLPHPPPVRAELVQGFWEAHEDDAPQARLAWTMRQLFFGQWTLGGTRVKQFASDAAAEATVLDLSKAMSQKAALSVPYFGGGKVVINVPFDPSLPENRHRKRFAQQEVAKVLESLQIIVTAVDMNTSDADVVEMSEVAPHAVIGVPGIPYGGEIASPQTARGIVLGMRAAAEVSSGNHVPDPEHPLRGMTIKLQGAGGVGSEVLRRLLTEEDVAKVYVAEPNEATKASIREDYLREIDAGRLVLLDDPEAIYDQPGELFSPNALPWILNKATITRLTQSGTVIIAGAANVQLATPEDGVRLHEAGILYVPDFVINSGGLRAVETDLVGYGLPTNIEEIYTGVKRVLEYAAKRRIPTASAADEDAKFVLYSKASELADGQRLEALHELSLMLRKGLEGLTDEDLDDLLGESPSYWSRELPRRTALLKQLRPFVSEEFQPVLAKIEALHARYLERFARREAVAAEPGTTFGSPLEALITLYQEFGARAFSRAEVQRYRLNPQTSNPFSESTVQEELRILRQVGLIRPVSEEEPHTYELIGPVRNLSPPDFETFLTHLTSELPRINDRPALARFTIPTESLLAIRDQVAQILQPLTPGSPATDDWEPLLDSYHPGRDLLNPDHWLDDPMTFIVATAPGVRIEPLQRRALDLRVRLVIDEAFRRHQTLQLGRNLPQLPLLSKQTTDQALIERAEQVYELLETAAEELNRLEEFRRHRMVFLLGDEPVLLSEGDFHLIGSSGRRSQFGGRFTPPLPSHYVKLSLLEGALDRQTLPEEAGFTFLKTWLEHELDVLAEGRYVEPAPSEARLLHQGFQRIQAYAALRDQAPAWASRQVSGLVEIAEAIRQDIKRSAGNRGEPVDVLRRVRLANRASAFLSQMFSVAPGQPPQTKFLPVMQQALQREIHADPKRLPTIRQALQTLRDLYESLGELTARHLNTYIPDTSLTVGQALKELEALAGEAAAPAAETGKGWGAQAALPPLHVVYDAQIRLARVRGIGRPGPIITDAKLEQNGGPLKDWVTLFQSPERWAPDSLTSQWKRGEILAYLKEVTQDNSHDVYYEHNPLMQAVGQAMVDLYERTQIRPDVQQAIGALLGRKENGRIRLIVVAPGVLGTQMARYYDEQRAEAVIAIDATFYQETVERRHETLVATPGFVQERHVVQKPAQVKGARRVFLERFLHELGHDNTIGTYEEELAEETRVLREVDFFLYKQLGGPDEDVKAFLNTLSPEVKPLVTGNDKYKLFAELLRRTQYMQGGEEAFLREELREYASTIVSGDLRRFGKAAGFPTQPPSSEGPVPLLTGLSLEGHPEVLEFARQQAAFLQAVTIEVVDESEDERLLKEAVEAGEISKLPDGNYYARSHPFDVARSEERTSVATRTSNDRGLYNNWRHTDEIRPEVEQRLQGSMKGKTMYAIPYLMGPAGSPFAQAGVMVTDSRYVAINMIRMTKVGRIALEELGGRADFVKGIHSTGDLNAIRRAAKPGDPDDRYFVSFPEERLIMSFGSAYGGNALLGKKFHSLRQAEDDARKEGWLAEHMLIVGIEDLHTRKIRYIAAAFPSASGKTNLAMLQPPEALKNRYRVWLVSDDIAWMRLGTDGRLRAVNPENGLFGVVPGTNERTNPNAMKAIGPGTKTIFTNVAYNEKTGELWWEGKTPQPPTDLDGWLDWQGKRIADRAPEDRQKPWAHPNSRFTTWATNVPNLSPQWQDSEGVPISAILFGGRLAQREPLIRQLPDPTSGIYDGLVMGVEMTAAAAGTVGEFRPDPMAMRPFFSYHEADYVAHWIDVMQHLGDKAPGFFHVNWFRKGPDGKFLWPGYGENLRVLLWALDRAEGRGTGLLTPVGVLPLRETFNREGLNIPMEHLDQVLAFNPEEWQEEPARRTDYLAKLGNRLPEPIRQAHERFVEALSQPAPEPSPSRADVRLSETDRAILDPIVEKALAALPEADREAKRVPVFEALALRYLRKLSTPLAINELTALGVPADLADALVRQASVSTMMAGSAREPGGKRPAIEVVNPERLKTMDVRVVVFDWLDTLYISMGGDLFPEAADLINELAQANITLYVATTYAESVVHRTLKRAYLHEQVTVIHGDKESALREIMRKSAVQPYQIVLIGDDVKDMQAARAIGAIAVGVRTRWSPETLIANGADVILNAGFERPEELVAFLTHQPAPQLAGQVSDTLLASLRQQLAEGLKAGRKLEDIHATLIRKLPVGWPLRQAAEALLWHVQVHPQESSTWLRKLITDYRLPESEATFLTLLVQPSQGGGLTLQRPPEQLVVFAQDFVVEGIKQGGQTSDISLQAIKNAGVHSVLVGHSETRKRSAFVDRVAELIKLVSQIPQPHPIVAALQPEIDAEDAEMREKVRVALSETDKQDNPWFIDVNYAIGETLRERNAGKKSWQGVLRRQLETALNGLAPEQAKRLTIAYEPRWAIGTNITPKNEEIQETHAFIRSVLRELFGDLTDELPILYGGSVKKENVREIVSLPDVDGALVGGASTDPDHFLRIAEIVAEVYETKVTPRMPKLMGNHKQFGASDAATLPDFLRLNDARFGRIWRAIGPNHAELARYASIMNQPALQLASVRQQIADYVSAMTLRELEASLRLELAQRGQLTPEELVNLVSTQAEQRAPGLASHLDEVQAELSAKSTQQAGALSADDISTTIRSYVQTHRLSPEAERLLRLAFLGPGQGGGEWHPYWELRDDERTAIDPVLRELFGHIVVERSPIGSPSDAPPSLNMNDLEDILALAWRRSISDQEAVDQLVGLDASRDVATAAVTRLRLEATAFSATLLTSLGQQLADGLHAGRTLAEIRATIIHQLPHDSAIRQAAERLDTALRDDPQRDASPLLQMLIEEHGLLAPEAELLALLAQPGQGGGAAPERPYATLGSRLSAGDETVIPEIVAYRDALPADDSRRQELYEWLQHHESKLAAKALAAIGLNWPGVVANLLAVIEGRRDGTLRSAARQLHELAGRGTYAGLTAPAEVVEKAKETLAANEARAAELIQDVVMPAFPTLAKDAEPGRLVLVRHGETSWSEAVLNKWAGWHDSKVTENGRQEAREAGRRIEGLRFDQAYTSDLSRAQDTLTEVLHAVGQPDVPTTVDRALRERNYGDLIGWNRKDVEEKFGTETYTRWRRGYAGDEVRPPGGENLKDVQERTVPYFVEHVLADIAAGKNVVVSAHGNSLRSILVALREHTEGRPLTEEEILKLEVPLSTPILVRFDQQLRHRELWADAQKGPADVASFLTRSSDSGGVSAQREEDESRIASEGFARWLLGDQHVVEHMVARLLARDFNAPVGERGKFERLFKDGDQERGGWVRRPWEVLNSNWPEQIDREVRDLRGAGVTTFGFIGMGGESSILGLSDESVLNINSTAPAKWARLLAGRDLTTMRWYVVSKSGTTKETLANATYLEGRYRAQGLDPTKHITYVTDPGTGLEREKHEQGFDVEHRELHSQTSVGGRNTLANYPTLLAYAWRTLHEFHVSKALAESAFDEASQSASQSGYGPQPLPQDFARLLSQQGPTKNIRQMLLALTEAHTFEGEADPWIAAAIEAAPFIRDGHRPKVAIIQPATIDKGQRIWQQQNAEESLGKKDGGFTVYTRRPDLSTLKRLQDQGWVFVEVRAEGHEADTQPYAEAARADGHPVVTIAIEDVESDYLSQIVAYGWMKFVATVGAQWDEAGINFSDQPPVEEYKKLMRAKQLPLSDAIDPANQVYRVAQGGGVTLVYDGLYPFLGNVDAATIGIMRAMGKSPAEIFAKLLEFTHQRQLDALTLAYYDDADDAVTELLNNIVEERLHRQAGYAAKWGEGTGVLHGQFVNWYSGQLHQIPVHIVATEHAQPDPAHPEGARILIEGAVAAHRSLVEAKRPSVMLIVEGKLDAEEGHSALRAFFDEVATHLNPTYTPEAPTPLEPAVSVPKEAVSMREIPPYFSQLEEPGQERVDTIATEVLRRLAAIPNPDPATLAFVDVGRLLNLVAGVFLGHITPDQAVADLALVDARFAKLPTNELRGLLPSATVAKNSSVFDLAEPTEAVSVPREGLIEEEAADDGTLLEPEGVMSYTAGVSTPPIPATLAIQEVPASVILPLTPKVLNRMSYLERVDALDVQTDDKARLHQGQWAKAFGEGMSYVVSPAVAEGAANLEAPVLVVVHSSVYTQAPDAAIAHQRILDQVHEALQGRSRALRFVLAVDGAATPQEAEAIALAMVETFPSASGQTAALNASLFDLIAPATPAVNGDKAKRDIDVLLGWLEALAPEATVATVIGPRAWARAFQQNARESERIGVVVFEPSDDPTKVASGSAALIAGVELAVAVDRKVPPPVATKLNFEEDGGALVTPTLAVDPELTATVREFQLALEQASRAP